MKASNKQAPERGMNQTSTEELIKQLENRLDWLTSQPAEDMNEEEIENILNLLDTAKIHLTRKKLLNAWKRITCITRKSWSRLRKKRTGRN